MLEIISCEHRSQRDAYVHYVEVRTSTKKIIYINQ